MAKTILVVDDDAAIRACLSDILTEHGGFTVHAARDGVDALRLIDGGLAFDVLLTDRRMPNMGGEELIAAVRSRGCRQFVILMSGDVRLPAGMPGVDRVEPKPLSIFGLIDVINAVVPRPA